MVMIENLPAWLPVLFICTTLLTIFIFYKALHSSLPAIIILVIWLIVQAMVALSGFYTYTRGLPPRFVLLPLPPLIVIIALFISPGGRNFIDNLNLKALTWIHIVRVPVEIVLWGLYLNKQLPQVMTFEGRNPDILSGLTVPLMIYFCFQGGKYSSRILLLWNVICLLLLVNIVSLAVLSAPFPIQQLAFDQPNVAVLYFPFVWLPCCIVPLVLLSHLAAIRRLMQRKNIN